MTHIQLLPEEDYEDFVTIVANAYPGIKIVSAEDKEKLQERLLRMQEEEPTVDIYGAYRDGELVGGMRLHDFRMNFRGQQIKTGGVGLVAVDLLRKKEKVARDMLRYFLNHCREAGAYIAALYPFRPDFYKRMGFGFGTPMSQYRLRPDSFPRGPSKEHLSFLPAVDKEALRDCYDRYMAQTHGMLAKSEQELESLFRHPANHIVAYREGLRVRGYIVYNFKPSLPESFINNDLHVRELVYESPAVLSELLTFLHTQDDQVDRVVLHTQDEHFHHLLLDPRNGSGRLIPSVYHESHVQGIGLMYRVVDTAALFGLLDTASFGGPPCRLRLNIRDDFGRAGSALVHFQKERLQVQSDGKADVEIGMDVAEFSSMLMGVVPFQRLHAYGLAEVSPEDAVETVDQIFRLPYRPICTTPF